MRVLFSGGGTGGHIYPALAIIRGLKDAVPGVEVLYVGTNQGLEARLVPGEGLAFQTINVSGMKRKLSLETVLWAGRTGQAVMQAVKILRHFKPAVVVGTGGYVCGPVILAAAMLRIPAILHEQNALPGKTNRWLAPFVDRILVTFPESAQYFGKHGKRVIFTGLPVRQEILNMSRAKGADILGISAGKLTLMVVGGSQGAKSINEAIIGLLATVKSRPDLQLVWVTGTSQCEWVMEQLKRRGINPELLGNITIRPYLHQVAAALAVADLVISRAGATFLAETTARGIASILIPYPHATDNHQEYNAKNLVKKGAAIMVHDDELSTGILTEKVQELLDNPEKLKEMSRAAKKAGKPEALASIIKEITVYI